MEAKDTILTKRKVTEIILKVYPNMEAEFNIDYDCIQLTNGAQAEISFALRTDDILKQLNGFNQRGLTLTEAIALLQ